MEEKSKNNPVAEYSLKDISKPIGVSEYKVTSSFMILYLTKVKFTEKGDSNDAADNCIG